MQVTLNIDIECGETTCWVLPGVFCRLHDFKELDRCTVYGKLDLKDGIVQRHSNCIADGMRGDVEDDQC